MKEEDLLPCPCRGNEFPFEYITYSCCILRCKCGIELHNAAVRVVYKSFDEVPEELKPYANPANALVFEREGKLIQWEEHQNYGVSCMRAFEHAGFTAKWNKRWKA